MGDRGRRGFNVSGRGTGKSELARIIAEAYLDAGKTVIFISHDQITGEILYERRGIDTAKDITPPKPLGLPSK